MKSHIFYIRKFNFITDESEIDVPSISPIMRRKLSLLDKTALSLTSKIFDDRVRELIFSSEYGEFTRLDTIIKQYQEAGEVSPTQFSASVHNYPISFFTLYNKLNIPYQAISSGENSLDAGLVKSVISNKEVLFTFADVYNNIKGFSALISPKEGEIKIEYQNTHSDKMSFEDFINFIEGKNDIYTSTFGIYKRILD